MCGTWLVKTGVPYVALVPQQPESESKSRPLWLRLNLVQASAEDLTIPNLAIRRRTTQVEATWDKQAAREVLEHRWYRQRFVQGRKNRLGSRTSCLLLHNHEQNTTMTPAPTPLRGKKEVTCSTRLVIPGVELMGEAGGVTHGVGNRRGKRKGCAQA